MKTHNHGVTFSDNDILGINNLASGGAFMIGINHHAAVSGKGVGDTAKLV
jgi:hypothetical protein